MAQQRRTTQSTALCMPQRCVESLQAAVSTSALEGVTSAELPPLQQAQVKCAQIQAALALGRCLHVLQGEGSEAVDALQSERTMLEAYSKKVKAAVAKQELGHHKRGTEINIDAAHRFITHAIPDLSKQARQELQNVRLASGAMCFGSLIALLQSRRPLPF
jgi:hypothetical protein